MSRVIADGLSKRVTATTAEAEAGTADKYPDAAGVHAAFNQYGLGIEVNDLVVVDFNTLPESEYVNGVSGTAPIVTGTASTNHPPDFPNCFVRHYFYDFSTTSICVQVAINLFGQRFSRRRVDGPTGTWGVWKIGYDSDNILGTVSQSAGVPTGAIIERGSNANGEYVKFADGTLICAKTFTGVVTDTTIGSVYAKSLGPWTFPAAFAVPPRYIGSARTSTNYLSGSVAGGTVLTSSVQDIVAFGARVDSNGDVYAATIGRWY